jgi:hypothetical protein
VVAFELTYDDAGKVTAAIPHGLDGARARACATAVARKVTREEAGVSIHRCSVAFGEMPASELPGVEITADDIRLDGKALATLKETDADDSWRVPSLVDAIMARTAAAISTEAPAVAVRGPLAIKPLPTTPMRYVDRVLSSAIAGDADPVLAVMKDDDWRLLSPIALPVVPTPRGTGGTWNRRSPGGRRATAIADDDERVVLSVLATSEQIWVGVSRLNEFQRIASGPSQVAELASVLATHKASVFFVDRADVELAAEGDVTYAAFVEVIEAATAAGFTAWRETEPNGLTARPTL